MLTILLVWGYSGLLFLTDKSGLAESKQENINWIRSIQRYF
jgi:hypothetical protein